MHTHTLRYMTESMAYQLVFHCWAGNTPVHLTIFHNACISQSLHWQFVLEQQKTISYQPHKQTHSNILTAWFLCTPHASNSPTNTHFSNFFSLLMYITWPSSTALTANISVSYLAVDGWCVWQLKNQISSVVTTHY